jgi:predicted nucleotidyltransferase
MKPDKTGWKYSPLVIILRYWLVQGMVYMNWVERIHRVIIELLLFGFLYSFLSIIHTGAKPIPILILCHTLNLFLNGHFIALCVHDIYLFSLYRDKKKFFDYIDKIRNRIENNYPWYLNGAVFWGSISRGEFKETSDLDIRFISEPGFLAAICTSQLVFMERFRALLAGFPLDIYMFRTEAEMEEKMDVVNEPAVWLYKRKKDDSFIIKNQIDYRDFKAKYSVS